MKFATRLVFPLFGLFLALCFGEARVQAAPEQHLTPSLVADTVAIEAGKPFTVGVLWKIEPGWHTYWQSAGEIGSPLEVAWELPEGFHAGPLQWSLPQAILDNDFWNFVYEGEAMLMAEITPPAKLPAGNIALKAKVKWQVCSESTPAKMGVCIPGSGEVSVALPAGSATPANADLFAKWRNQLPRTTAPPKVSWDLATPKQATLTIEGLAADQRPEFFALPPGSATPSRPTNTKLDPSGVRKITVPIDTAAPADAVWRGLLVVEKDGKREGWYVASNALAGEVAAAPATIPGGETPPTGSTPPAALQNPPTLFGALAFAFLGGLILNVMPCVLPVIALKIFGFVKQAGQDPRRVFHLGLAFVAGVFTFFLSLAAVAVALHASGKNLAWGSQFQNPYLLAGLIALIFVFGLNLLGVFEITLSGGATSAMSDLSSREGFGGAFLHGVFTTLLGTSCTAPFLAISLGFALTQSAAVIFLLFATVAAGMSLPYFLLTAVPAWMKYLPKPGAWMERFKQITGFIMLAVVVWLFSVMADSRPNAATHLSWYLFALAIACWAMGAYQSRIARLGFFPLVAIAGYFVLLQGPLADASQIKGSDLTRRVDTALKTGNPVFVDFTAGWCANCKAFEKAVLHNDKVKTAFEDRKVVTVVADWTNPDAEIESWLKRFGRAGVPLYLLYRPGETQPVVMDSMTVGGLLAELDKSSGPK